MKRILIIIVITIFTLNVNAQQEISCFGEIIKKNEQIIKRNKDVGTIFTIDEKEKTITIKTSTRYGLTQDLFKIENSFSSEYAKVYTCKKENDESKYFVTVMKDKVTLLLDKQQILIESPIISIKNINK